MFVMWSWFIYLIFLITYETSAQNDDPEFCTQRRANLNAGIICKQRLICYFGSWSVYRPNDGRFSVENIDPTKCTHLVYAFVGLNGIDKEPGIRVLDMYNDLWTNYGKGAFRRFVRLKGINPNIRTMVSIGGQNEVSSKFSQAFNSTKKREAFVRNTMKFLKDHEFDGLDIDWKYPARMGGKPEDKENFAELLKALRFEFDRCGYLLSAFVSPSPSDALQSYDINTLVQNLDFIGVGTYNIHGSWEKTTGHNSPLYQSADEIGTASENQNIDAMIQGWLGLGAPAEKLLVGVGTFGRSFTLSSLGCSTPRCGRRGAGAGGPYTTDPGFLGYNELCSILNDRNTTVTFDNEAKVPYAVNKLLWVSYDNEESIEYKVDYVVRNQLGGIMTWSIDTDDYKGNCGQGPFPLLKTMQKVVNCRLLQPGETPSITTETIMRNTSPTSTTVRNTTPRRTVAVSTVKTTTSAVPIFRTTSTTIVRTTPSSTTPRPTSTTQQVIFKNSEDEPSGCILPYVPSGGKYKLLNAQHKYYPDDIVPHGIVLEYWCMSNFDVTEKHAFCQEDNQWSSIPVCRKRCKLPQSTTVDFLCYNSTQFQVDCTPYVPSGSVVRFKCKDYHKNTNNFNYAMSCDDGSFDYGVPRCEPDCGLEPAEGTTFIIDGSPVKRGTFPWHVAVYELRGKINPVYTQICGGTLVATNLVISAAHCFYSRKGGSKLEEKFALAIGKLNRDWYNEDDELYQTVHKSTVRRILMPDTYKGSALNHQSDIALLELVNHVTFSNTIHPACLKLNDDEITKFHPEVYGKVAGWGLTTEDGESSADLRFLSVPTVGFDECLKELEKYNTHQYLTNDKLCAGYLNGSSVCKGDSGGGLVFPEKERSTGLTRWYLRGIVSVGPANEDFTSCRKNTYTAYTDVNHFKKWIADELQLYKL